ncbi:PDZ domain-containing protein, partial [Stenotrophomonas maltophilia]|uniref:PDZ domain-containing protein n=1 Tax=Stenotrophomonas maltophilia TaxID=40324 RepID=UPI0013D9ACA5
LLTRVVEGTPAAAADLAVGDRVNELDDESFADGAALLTAINSKLDSGTPKLTLLIERRGHGSHVAVNLA